MIVSVLIFFFSSVWSGAACLPNSIAPKKNLVISEMRVMEQIAQRFESTMVRDFPKDHELVIRFDPLNPRINAEVTMEDGFVAISVWGGMLSHPKMKPNTLLILLCHELGHFLGGPPLKSRTGWSSTEGQADYYSSLGCVKNFGVNEGEFIEAATAITSIYAEVTQQPRPQLDRCDQSIVNRINYGYPTAQCRLDTLIAGWKENPRPACWFIE
jgi:hypothetical protein